MFDITVVTTVSLCNFPCSFMYLPHTYMIKSPSMRFPFSSTARHLSASPSYAKPTSKLLSTTNFCKDSICVEPQFVLIFVPSGSLWMTNVFAPNASNTLFAMADALPLEQSKPTRLFLKERVGSEIKYPM